METCVVARCMSQPTAFGLCARHYARAEERGAKRYVLGRIEDGVYPRVSDNEVREWISNMRMMLKDESKRGDVARRQRRDLDVLLDLHDARRRLRECGCAK